MKDQLLRASSSIALNLSEGSSRRSQKERLRFFNISLGSLRETQTICQLENLKDLAKKYDQLGAMIFVLNRAVAETVTETVNRKNNSE